MESFRKVKQDYPGPRHLRAENLSPLRRELKKQLHALKPVNAGSYQFQFRAPRTEKPIVPLW